MNLQENPGRIIKDINKLGLHEETLKIIKQLSSQIEFPLVFWVGASGEVNAQAQHPYNPNQFWITIKSGTPEKEIERLIIYGIYRQIQLRKRYMCVSPTKDFQSKLEKLNDPEATKRNIQLVHKINSFMSSLINEIHFAPDGILTDSDVIETGFQELIKHLDSYIECQHQMRGFCWYRENQLENVIDFGNYIRRSARYKYQIEKRISKIRPKQEAEKISRQMRKISELIIDATQNCKGDEGIYVEKSLNILLKILNIDEDFEVVTNNARHTLNYIDNKPIDIYSFVPEGMEEEKLFLRAVRYMNECLGLFREVVDLDEKYPVAQITVSYDDYSNMYAYKESEDNYRILVFLNTIRQLNEIISSECGDSMKELNSDLIMKYSLFFMTLHEYAHILNGDCETEDSQRRLVKEQRADEFAYNYLPVVIRAQYREEDLGEFKANILCDSALIDAVIIVVKRYRVSANVRGGI